MFRKIIYRWTALIFIPILLLASADQSPAAEPGDLGSLELLQDGLQYPANIAWPDDGSERIFAVEHVTGKIRVIQNGAILPKLFIDLGDKLLQEFYYETGLLALVFPKNFQEKKYVYITYTSRNNEMTLSRFKVTQDTSQAIKSSEEVILATEPVNPFHQCGHMTFGVNDPYLYLCVGDTNIPETGQDTSEIYSGILRLDVESGENPYGIPPDNPFANSKDKRPEIWAYGLRNPWKFDFDAETGDLFIPDVGDYSWEELNFQPAFSKGGENYGWSPAEGHGCPEGCDGENFTWPIFEYPHGDLGCAVIGGAVYRGKQFPQWHGVYVFTDRCAGKLWAIRDVFGKPQIRVIVDGPKRPLPNAITPSYDGELILVNARGKLQKVIFPKNFNAGWDYLERAVAGWQATMIENLKERSWWREFKKPFIKYYKLFKKWQDSFKYREQKTPTGD